ncbi:Hypothetical predicted protein [Paramuricea clavata]|uniref:Uncharacterized protein n=1 Tax=Paramuricea clavata TaxID=317549 RepID=A0A6S7I7I1_PARCT|nr:Hypothetical predicted protein [Paramuricea clavata]
MTDGLINPGRSTYILDLPTSRRLDAMRFKTESCRHVYLPVTCKSDSGQKQNEQLADDRLDMSYIQRLRAKAIQGRSRTNSQQMMTDPI